jgi:hypothetical protein
MIGRIELVTGVGVEVVVVVMIGCIELVTGVGVEVVVVGNTTCACASVGIVSRDKTGNTKRTTIVK